MIFQEIAKLFKFYSVIDGVTMKDSALVDAYRIHGEGVARMIPEKLVKREKFQKNLKLLDEIHLGSDSSEENKNQE